MAALGEAGSAALAEVGADLRRAGLQAGWELTSGARAAAGEGGAETATAGDVGAHLRSKAVPPNFLIF